MKLAPIAKFSHDIPACKDNFVNCYECLIRSLIYWFKLKVTWAVNNYCIQYNATMQTQCNRKQTHTKARVCFLYPFRVYFGSVKDTAVTQSRPRANPNFKSRPSKSLLKMSKCLYERIWNIQGADLHLVIR